MISLVKIVMGTLVSEFTERDQGENVLFRPFGGNYTVNVTVEGVTVYESTIYLAIKNVVLVIKDLNSQSAMQKWLWRRRNIARITQND